MNATEPTSTKSSNNWIWTALRWGVTATLLVFVIKSGKLSLKDIQTFVASPGLATLSFSLICGVVLCTFLRWKLLLGALGLEVPYWTALRMGMLGQFFSAMIPGTVGGDLVKAVYLAKRFPNQKTRALATLFLDRLSGLMAMLILGSLSFLVGLPHLREMTSPVAHLILAFGWILAWAGGALALGLALFPFLARRLPKTPPAFLAKLPLTGVTSQLYEVALDYRERPFVIWGVVVMSMGMHLIAMFAMSLVARSIYGAPPWGTMSHSLFVLSAVLGNCAMAIPIAPMGLGIGQVAFSTVFFALGAPADNFGTSVITGTQLLQFSVAMLGAFFYLTYKHEVDEAKKSAADLDPTSIALSK